MFSMYFQGFEAYRWVDLVEIYPLDPSKSFAFDFRQHTFAYTRTSNLATLDNLGYNSEGRINGYRQDNGERRRKYWHHNPRTHPRGGFPPRGLYICSRFKPKPSVELLSSYCRVAVELLSSCCRVTVELLSSYSRSWGPAVRTFQFT